MGAPFNSVSEAQDGVNELAEHEQELEVQIANLMEEVAAINDMKKGALRWIRAKRATASRGNNRPITVEDIKHCRTQRAVLREWALRNGGYARITDVAEFIMETDLAKGEKDSVRSSLTNYVKESDLWRYHSPGVYVLLEAICPDENGDEGIISEHGPDSEHAAGGETPLSPVMSGDLPAPLTVAGHDQKQCA